MQEIIKIGLIFAMLLVAVLFKVAFLKLVRYGMPDKYPDFPGGEERLNRAIFSYTSVQIFVWLPVIFSIIILDDEVLDGASKTLPYVIALFAYVLAHEHIFNWLVKRPAATILRDYEKFKAERTKQVASRLAGDRRYKRSKKETRRRWTVDHLNESRQSDLDQRRPPLSELR